MQLPIPLYSGTLVGNLTKDNYMLETLFWIAIGAFIGWNLPQPQIAKNFQAKYLQKHIDKVKAFLPFFK
jgi:hypothetical protein